MRNALHISFRQRYSIESPQLKKHTLVSEGYAQQSCPPFFVLAGHRHAPP
jgi:hypothetical protein